MKALVAYAPGELRLVDAEKPRPGPREVLARVSHCGVCATDVSIMKGTLRLGEGNEPVYPVRLGHEWSGVVEELGSETWRLKKGDRIISDTCYSCGECEMCLSGEYQNCEKGRAIGTIRDAWPGGFAEYMVMPERLAFQVPDNVGLDEAALVEPASIGLYGLLRSPMGPGKTLLVLGTGPIGLGGMACARGMGSGKIILAGRKDKKLAVGQAMGADVVVNTLREDLFSVVMRETGGKGADVILETTGDPALFNDTLSMLRASGTLVIPAFYEQSLDHVLLDRLIVRNCTLVGAAGTPNMGRKILDMLANGRASLRPMITDRFRFGEFRQAFEAFDARNDSRIKIMVDF